MEDFQRYTDKISTIIDGGLLAICVVILQGIMSISTIDISLTVAIIALALAIPALVFLILIRILYAIPSLPEIETPMSHVVLMISGWVAAIIAVDAVIWHVSLIAGIVFLISGLAGFVIYSDFESKARSISKEQDKKIESIP